MEHNLLLSTNITQDDLNPQANPNQLIVSISHIEELKLEEKSESNQNASQQKVFYTGVSVKDKMKAFQNIDQPVRQVYNKELPMNVIEKTRTLFQNTGTNQKNGTENSICNSGMSVRDRTQLLQQTNTIKEKGNSDFSHAPASSRVKEIALRFQNSNNLQDHEKKMHSTGVSIAEKIAALNNNQTDNFAKKELKIEGIMTLAERKAKLQSGQETTNFSSYKKPLINEYMPTLTERKETMSKNQAEQEKTILHKKEESLQIADSPEILALKQGVLGLQNNESQDNKPQLHSTGISVAEKIAALKVEKQDNFVKNDVKIEGLITVAERKINLLSDRETSIRTSNKSFINEDTPTIAERKDLLSKNQAKKETNIQYPQDGNAILKIGSDPTKISWNEWMKKNHSQSQDLIEETLDYSNFNEYDDQIMFFRHGTKMLNNLKIVSLDVQSKILDDLSENILWFVKRKFSLPNNIYLSITICELPNKTKFCYGSNFGLTFIIDHYENLKLLPNGKPNYWLDSKYHNNFVYAIGGWNKLAEKYNLLKNRWESCALIPYDYDFSLSRSALIGNQMVIVGWKFKTVICYDINKNTYEILTGINLEIDVYKFTFKCENRVYIGEHQKNFYESGENDLNIWSCISTTNPMTGYYQISYYCLINESVFFLSSNYNLYEFKLRTKEMKLIKNYDY